MFIFFSIIPNREIDIEAREKNGTQMLASFNLIDNCTKIIIYVYKFYIYIVFCSLIKGSEFHLQLD